MSQDVQALFREGVAEARLGNRKAARELFEKVVALDPKHEKGWLWLASVAGSDEDQKQYLQRVLELNPNNERAQRALEKLLAREKTTTAAQEEIAPGVSRRSVAVVAGAAILAVIVVIVARPRRDFSNDSRSDNPSVERPAEAAAITTRPALRKTISLS